MRLPNGYGSVIKLKGKRRKPYAVRTSEISEFVEIDAPKEPPSNILRDFVRYNFKWQWRKQNSSFLHDCFSSFSRRAAPRSS